MPRLTALGVRNAKPGRHGDGDGLYLLVKPSGAKSWVLRVQAGGKRQDIGLGSVDVSPTPPPGKVEPSASVPLLQRRVLRLVDAREKAKQLREFARAGENPVAERDREREREQTPTFRDTTIACHAALAGGWSADTATKFLSSLEAYAFPAFGSERVDAIEAANIRDMLAPIWTAIPETARKVRRRVGTVLNFAHSKGWRPTEAPGKSVTMGLPKQSAGGNYAAMPYADVPAFVADLRSKPETVGRNALLLLILTAARSGEVRSARWGHFDLARANWNVPAELMKMKVAHTFTLNAPAVALLTRVFDARKPKPDDFVFPNAKGAMVSDMTLTKVLRDADQPYTAHGFRSSFRDWAAERMPHIPDAVAEAALAHSVPDQVVRAYKRTTFTEMRRELLDAWSTFVASGA